MHAPFCLARLGDGCTLLCDTPQSCGWLRVTHQLVFIVSQATLQAHRPPMCPCTQFACDRSMVQSTAVPQITNAFKAIHEALLWAGGECTRRSEGPTRPTLRPAFSALNISKCIVSREPKYMSSHTLSTPRAERFREIYPDSRLAKTTTKNRTFVLAIFAPSNASSPHLRNLRLINVTNSLITPMGFPT